MTMQGDLGSRLEEALPGSFEFYHLGEVVPAGDAGPVPAAHELASRSIIAFSVQGDARALALVLFEKGLDHSTYTEMGNVIVSRLASHLDVMISPPREVSPGLAAELLAGAPVIARRTYLHESAAPTAMVEVLLLSHESLVEPHEEAAHA